MPSKLYGDWSKVKVFTKRFPKSLHQQMEESETREASDIQKEIRDGILGQKFGHTPLKPETIERKGSSETLVDTGALANSFEVVPMGEGKAIVPVGQSDSGLSMSELMTIHEYGTQKIPARPVVRPTYDKVTEEVQKDVSKDVEKEIAKYL